MSADPTEVQRCLFCQIVDREVPSTVVHEWSDALCIVPLNPVVHGHVIVMPKGHVDDAIADPQVTASTMHRAAEVARRYGYSNIITSIGEPATQSIFHLHVHVVPRRIGDGLPLPWTPQQAAARVVPDDAARQGSETTEGDGRG